MKQKWLVEIEENIIGRDFIVGDLHGNYTALMESLHYVNFNFENDRLFCVGDIIDRGKEIKKCLSLLKEKWFFSVLGNHEFMVLSKFGEENKILNRIQSFLYNDDRQTIKNSEIYKYINDIKSLPVVIFVNHSISPFYIIHASRPIKNGKITSDIEIEEMKKYDLKDNDKRKMLWNRKLSKEALKINKFNKKHDILMAYPIEEGVSFTYSGHTIMKNIIIHRSHIFIDGGKYKGGDLRVVEHNEIIQHVKRKLESH